MTWDLTSYFPQFDGLEMRQFKEALRTDVATLREQAASLPPLSEESADGWEQVLIRNEDLSRRLSHLSSYISCLASSDARNEAYLKEEAGLTRQRAELAKVRIELVRAVKNASEEVFSSFAARTALAGAGHYLNRLREEARRVMAVEKEILATDLGVDGIQAWGRLYNTISSKLEFDMVYPDGKVERLAMSQRRSLMDHPDRRIRKAAFDGGNAAWQTVEDAAAAALNAIGGTRLTLNRHRGVEHFLDIALFQASIGRKTLDAMFEALFANVDLPAAFSEQKRSRWDKRALPGLTSARRWICRIKRGFLGTRLGLQSKSHLSAPIQPSANSSKNRSSTRAGSTGNRGSASGRAVFARARCCPRNRAFSLPTMIPWATY